MAELVSLTRQRKKHVEGVDVHIAIAVEVGDAEQVVGTGDMQAGLFKHFTDDAFFTRLIHIGETTRKVERALRRLFLATDYQQLVMLV